jgi:hypothetical protein
VSKVTSLTHAQVLRIMGGFKRELHLSNHYPTYRDLGNKFAQLKHEPLTALWSEDWRNKHHAPPLMTKESTFASCTNISATFKDGRIVLIIRLYDGRLLDGDRESVRCWWTYELPDRPEFELILQKLVVPPVLEGLRTLAQEEIEREAQEAHERELERRIAVYVKGAEE